MTAALLSGCVGYAVDPALPKVTADGLPPVATPLPVKLVFKINENGKQTSASKGRRYFVDSLKRSKAFTVDPKASTELRVTEDDTFDPGVQGKAFLSGLTFTLAPVDERADMKFKVELVQPGRPTVERSYATHVRALTGSKTRAYPNVVDSATYAKTVSDSIIFRFVQELQSAKRI